MRTLIVAEAPLSADELRSDLQEAGSEIVAELADAETVAQMATRHSAELVVAATINPSPQLFEAARLLASLSPCPFIVFTSDPDAAKIIEGADSGVHAYVVDGYARHRLTSIIQVARARFRNGQTLRDELRGLSQRFDERKLVDRAKGVLMRSRGVPEDEAFELLRSLAMRSRQRIGVVAQSVIDMSRAGEAMNRAGQLRMLSQRIVKCTAQSLCGFDVEAAQRMKTDAMARVDANLRILRRAISTEGYGELVERVTLSWQALSGLAAAAPDPSLLAALDAGGEAMLGDAEALTQFLGSSGLVASLQILNVSGRQRMLSQRMAKLCFLLALAPDPSQLSQLRTLIASFQSAIDYLSKVPLDSPAIRACLGPTVAEWTHLRSALGRISDAAALRDVVLSSERLLELTERLTDQYEQAMQVLIGDRMIRLA